MLIRLPLAIWLVATGMSGIDPDRLNPAERVLRVALGIALLTPYIPVQVGAFVVGVVLIGFHILQRRRAALAAS